MRYILPIAASFIGGCSTLRDAAISALGGSKGVSVEANVAKEIDKSTNVGTTTNVTSDAVGYVADTAQQAMIIHNDQISMPLIWLIVGLIIVAMIFLVAPAPKHWKLFQRK